MRNLIITTLVMVLGLSETSNLLLEEPSIENRKNSFENIHKNGVNLSLAAGQTAELQCRTKNLGSRHVVWRRGYDVLATESQVLSPDPRISVREEGPGQFYLQLTNINTADMGEYVCQISTSGSSKLISIAHNLNVLVPARIQSRPETANLTVKEGEDALLECRATGNPKPTVTWKKQTPGENLGRSLMTSSYDCGESGNCLRLTGITRSEAGVYTCTANNNVGTEHSADIKLTVQYAPEVRPVSEAVQAGPGGQVLLQCRVNGLPPPSVTWFLDSSQEGPAGTQLAPSPGYIDIKSKGNLHTLMLKNTGLQSFGNYSCLALNSLGTARKYIEVHGRPSSADFLAEYAQPSKTSHMLSWQVQSFTTILEYRLLYRRIAKGSDRRSGHMLTGTDWNNLIIPGEQEHGHLNFGPQSNIKKMSWLLEGLEPDSEYECLVQARNKYGWSQPSKMFLFSTSVKTVSSAATQGLNWKYGSSSGAKGLPTHHSAPFLKFLILTLWSLYHLARP